MVRSNKRQLYMWYQLLGGISNPFFNVPLLAFLTEYFIIVAFFILLSGELKIYEEDPPAQLGNSWFQAPIQCGEREIPLFILCHNSFVKKFSNLLHFRSRVHRSEIY